MGFINTLLVFSIMTIMTSIIIYFYMSKIIYELQITFTLNNSSFIILFSLNLKSLLLIGLILLMCSFLYQYYVTSSISYWHLLYFLFLLLYISLNVS